MDRDEEKVQYERFQNSERRINLKRGHYEELCGTSNFKRCNTGNKINRKRVPKR